MILNLCRILDVDPNQILDWSEDQDYAELSTLEQKHIENYRSLESWQRKSIDELILRFLDHTEEETLTDTPVIQVPFYQVSPAAGSGNYMDENVDQETIELEDTPANRKIDYILKVDGHSMEPKFMDGEYVKVKKQQSVNIGEVGILSSMALLLSRNTIPTRFTRSIQLIPISCSNRKWMFAAWEKSSENSIDKPNTDCLLHNN